MRIGFIGYGSMTRALASRWLGVHEVMLGGRNPEKARGVAEELGVGFGADEREVVGGSDVVVLATRHEGVFDAIEACGGGSAFAGKVVVDINNPVDVGGSYVPKRYAGLSLSEAIADRMSDASVVKAFNMCQAAVWTMDPPLFDGRVLVTPICGDDGDAKGVVSGLVGLVGSEAWDVGGLEYAASLECVAGLVIKLLMERRDPQTVFNLIQPEVKPIG